MKSRDSDPSEIRGFDGPKHFPFIVGTMFQRIAKAFVLLPIFFVIGCIEGEEEIWINLDASGKIRAHYEFPAMLKAQVGDPAIVRKTLEDLDEREDGIEIQELRFALEEQKLVFHLEATFDDARDLLGIVERNLNTMITETGMDPAQAESAAGSIEFAMNGLSPTFRREMSLSGMFPTMVKNNPGLLGKSNFRYLIHLPFPATASNADEVFNDGKSLRWTFLLREHVEDPMTLSLTTKIVVPWWGWLTILVLLAGVLFFLLWLLRRRKPRNLAASKGLLDE